jgi:nitrite reductase (NO-forming)
MERTMLSRRAALMVGAGIAAAPFVVRAAAAQEEAVATPVAAPEDLSGLERIKRRLVAPPFVHEHEQVASGAPRIVEFEMTI